jgi:hypothetical protein
VGVGLTHQAPPPKIFEREKGSETGIHKGRRITRDAVFSAGFANSDPDGTRHARTRSKRATGNWWAIAESVRPGRCSPLFAREPSGGQSCLIQPSGLFDGRGESSLGAHDV